MDPPKRLQRLVDQALRLFEDYILPDQCQPGEKFACPLFIAHSFDLIMLEA